MSEAEWEAKAAPPPRQRGQHGAPMDGQAVKMKKRRKKKKRSKEPPRFETRQDRNDRVNREQRARRAEAIAKARSMERVLMRMRRRNMPMPGPGERVPTEEEVPATPRKEFLSAPSDALQRALDAEGVVGNRVVQKVGTQFVNDDFNSLEKNVMTCQVCFVGIEGCPCCWSFSTRKEELPERYDPLNMTSNALIRVGNRFAVGGPMVGTTAACDHTKLLTTLDVWRWRHNEMKQFTVIVKILPSGQAVRFGVLHTYDINYILFQFRSLAGDDGLQDKLELLLPTEVGSFHLSTAQQLPTDLATPFDFGSTTLEQWHCCERDSIIGLFTVPWVHDEKTPAIVNAWARMNFTLEKPWEPRIHRHFDELPATLPGTDQAQLLLGPWLNDSLEQQARQAAEDRRIAFEREQKMKLALEHARKAAAVARMKVTGSVAAKEERRLWRKSVRAARKKAAEDKRREAARMEREAIEAKASAEAHARQEAARRKAEADEAARVKTPGELRRLRKLARSRSKRSVGSKTSRSSGGGSRNSSSRNLLGSRGGDGSAGTAGGDPDGGFTRPTSSNSRMSAAPVDPGSPQSTAVRLGASMGAHLPSLIPPLVAEADNESVGSDRASRASGSDARRSHRYSRSSVTSAASRPPHSVASRSSRGSRGSAGNQRDSSRGQMDCRRPSGGQMDGRWPSGGKMRRGQPSGGQMDGRRPSGGQMDDRRPSGGQMDGRRPSGGQMDGRRPSGSSGRSIPHPASPIVMRQPLASNSGGLPPRPPGVAAGNGMRTARSHSSIRSGGSAHSGGSGVMPNSFTPLAVPSSARSHASRRSGTSVISAASDSSVASALMAGLAIAQNAMAASAGSLSSRSHASSIASLRGVSQATTSPSYGHGRSLDSRTTASSYSRSGYTGSTFSRSTPSGSRSGQTDSTLSRVTYTSSPSQRSFAQRPSPASVSQQSYESAHAPLSTGAWRV